MIFLAQPDTKTIHDFIAQQANLPFSYSHVGASRETPPDGYVLDHRRIRLGEGEAVFEAACAALRRWEMFNLPWVKLCWPNTPIEEGAVVAILARSYGMWWLNACRIVYLIDESSPIRKVGFAYGTLPDHAASGEERFIIEWHDDDSVWYDLLAFSRPNHWLMRLGYPIARQVQKRFGRASLTAMQYATQENI